MGVNIYIYIYLSPLFECDFKIRYIDLIIYYLIMSLCDLFCHIKILIFFLQLMLKDFFTN